MGIPETSVSKEGGQGGSQKGEEKSPTQIADQAVAKNDRLPNEWDKA